MCITHVLIRTAGPATGRVSLHIIPSLSRALLTSCSGAGYQSPYARQDDHAYEMADVNSSTNLTGSGGMPAFYSEVGTSL